MIRLETLIKNLQDYESPLGVVNPWRDFVDGLDIGPQAPEIRTEQLRDYLTPRIDKARYLLVAEAKGYQGGRFTGVPLTSERILLGRQPEIDPTLILPRGTAVQTSEQTVRHNGFAEPTATIVWKELIRLGIPSYQVVTWNIFPFHPYDLEKGYLSNRTPTAKELEIGGEFFTELLALCPTAKIIAIGRKAEETLGTLGFTLFPVRHPANGGAKQFREGLELVIGMLSLSAR